MSFVMNILGTANLTYTPSGFGWNEFHVDDNNSVCIPICAIKSQETMNKLLGYAKSNFLARFIYFMLTDWKFSKQQICLSLIYSAIAWKSSTADI